jgi:glutathione S-transferase
MLKLYANPISPFAQRIMLFLEEAQIPHEYVLLRADELGQEPFTRVSAFRTVPAIECDGFVMSESLAILRYLAQRYQKSSWYPENLEERARIDQLMDFGESMARPMMDLGKEVSMAPRLGRATDLGKVEGLRSELRKYLPRFEAYIAGRAFAVGAAPTIADMALAPFMHMYKYGDLPMTDFPETKSYADRLVDRPAMKKVLAAVAEAFRRKAPGS